MTYPQKTFFGFPKGWEDLGEIPDRVCWSHESKTNMYYPSLCTFCKQRVHAGKEDENRFWFCPKCKKIYKPS